MQLLGLVQSNWVSPTQPNPDEARVQKIEVKVANLNLIMFFCAIVMALIAFYKWLKRRISSFGAFVMAFVPFVKLYLMVVKAAFYSKKLVLNMKFMYWTVMKVLDQSTIWSLCIHKSQFCTTILSCFAPSTLSVFFVVFFLLPSTLLCNNEQTYSFLMTSLSLLFLLE